MNPLLQRAKAGDGAAFTELVAPLRPILVSYLYRRLADREAAEDLCQEVLLAAYAGLSQVAADADAKAWLFQLGSAQADTATRDQQPWGQSALDVLQDYLLGHPALEAELQATLEQHEEEYSLEDHVDFCFTVLLQSLLPRERNALLLTEIYGFSAAAAATISNTSPAEFGDAREDAGEELREVLSGRCSLIKAGAPCTQCRDFGDWLGEKETVEEELRSLPFRPGVDPETAFAKRLGLVRRVDPIHGGSSRFHEHLLQLLRRALGEKGLLKS